jgi:hypothetical protein
VGIVGLTAFSMVALPGIHHILLTILVAVSGKLAIFSQKISRQGFSAKPTLIRIAISDDGIDDEEHSAT